MSTSVGSWIFGSVRYRTDIALTVNDCFHGFLTVELKLSQNAVIRTRNCVRWQKISITVAARTAGDQWARNLGFRRTDRAQQTSTLPQSLYQGGFRRPCKESMGRVPALNLSRRLGRENRSGIARSSCYRSSPPPPHRLRCQHMFQSCGWLHPRHHPSRRHMAKTKQYGPGCRHHQGVGGFGRVPPWNWPTGASVALAARAGDRRSRPRCEAAGRKAAAVPTGVSDRGRWRLARRRSRAGHYDVWINDAGVAAISRRPGASRRPRASDQDRPIRTVWQPS